MTGGPHRDRDHEAAAGACRYGPEPGRRDKEIDGRPDGRARIYESDAEAAELDGVIDYTMRGAGPGMELEHMRTPYAERPMEVRDCQPIVDYTRGGSPVASIYARSEARPDLPASVYGSERLVVFRQIAVRPRSAWVRQSRKIDRPLSQPS